MGCPKTSLEWIAFQLEWIEWTFCPKTSLEWIAFPLNGSLFEKCGHSRYHSCRYNRERTVSSLPSKAARSSGGAAGGGRPPEGVEPLELVARMTAATSDKDPVPPSLKKTANSMIFFATPLPQIGGVGFFLCGF